MGSKEKALAELEEVIKKYDLADSTVGREIAGDPHFMERMRDEGRLQQRRLTTWVGTY